MSKAETRFNDLVDAAAERNGQLWTAEPPPSTPLEELSRAIDLVYAGLWAGDWIVVAQGYLRLMGLRTHIRQMQGDPDPVTPPPH